VSYLGGSPRGGLEAWEEEYGQRISSSIAGLAQRRRLQIILIIGMIAAVELANRMSINVILPDLQGNVAGSSDDVSWVLILYNLGFLCSLAMSFWMTRVLGARRHLLYSIALYGTGALGCACSNHNLTLLLVSRVVMGFGGGAFLVRMIILARLMIPPGKARANVFTSFHFELAFFLVLYPFAMGWISDSLYWNYAFLLDIPFLVVGALLISKYVPPGILYTRDKESYVDLWGAGLLIAALSTMQIGLSRGERDEWLDSPLISVSLLVALVCFVAFLWWDWRSENPSPVLHLRAIWRYVPLRASLMVVMIVGAILGAGLFVIPQYLRHVQDYSAAQTGGFVSAYAAGLVLGLMFTLRYLSPRFGNVKTIGFGALLMFGCCVNFLYIWTPTTPTHVLIPSLFLQGFALGPMVLGASFLASSQASVSEMNDVTTGYYFARQLGNTFGVTAATVLFDYRMTLHSSRLLDVANSLNPTTHSTLSQYAGIVARNGGAGSNPALGAVQIFQNNVITQSELLSYIDIYWGLALLSAVALFLLVFARAKGTAATHLHFHPW